jgi:Lysine-specific metallo-endopeptidase
MVVEADTVARVKAAPKRPRVTGADVAHGDRQTGTVSAAANQNRPNDLGMNRAGPFGLAGNRYRRRFRRKARTRICDYPFRRLTMRTRSLLCAMSLWICLGAMACVAEVGEFETDEPPEVAVQVQPLLGPTCGEGHFWVLNAAVPVARERSLSALRAFGANPSGPRTQKWFGDHNAGNLERIMGVLTDIVVGLNDPNLTYHCGHPTECFAPRGAFVHTGDPGNIYLCDLFWSQPIEGYPSMVQILTHEMAHFSRTWDNFAGPGDVQWFAQMNPLLTMQQADAYALYIVNP